MTASPVAENYFFDLKKSQREPLLLEINHQDLATFHPQFDAVSSSFLPLYVARKVYNASLKNKKETNLIIVNAGNFAEKNNFILLDSLLDQINLELKSIKNTEALKKIFQAGFSLATGGVVESYAGRYFDKSVDFIFDEFSEYLGNTFRDYVESEVNIADTVTNWLNEQLNDMTGDVLGGEIAPNKDTEIHLSKEAKNKLDILSKTFGDSAEHDIFQLAFKLFLIVCDGSSKLLFINNPQKLDSNSLALLSLLLSYGRHRKDNESHFGLSIVYQYSDPLFQPYTEVDKLFEVAQKAIDEQRRYAQRYGMLERPLNDTPKVAVKSSTFVGRDIEIFLLKNKFEKRNKGLITVISGEPGIGKTSLVNQHIKQIQQGKCTIALTMVNEVGHTSNNTGLSSLEISIVDEAHRLALLHKWKHKSVKLAKEQLNLENAVKVIGQLLGISVSGLDKGASAFSKVYERRQVDSNFETMKLRGQSDLDNHKQDTRKQQFDILDKALKKLKLFSESSQPVVLFIDDIQWIDNAAAEYILTRLLATENIYIVATLRPSDAATIFKRRANSPSVDQYVNFLFKAIEVIGHKEYIVDGTSNNDNLIKNPPTVYCETMRLTGLNTMALKSLLTKTIQGKSVDINSLAEGIFEALSDGHSDTINTLFAIESINILCDKTFYSENDSSRLILELPQHKKTHTTAQKQFVLNPQISNIQVELKKTFTQLKKKHETSLSHVKSKDNGGSFNLMAYAVMEERLHLIKLYFDEHGNAAVNTLLFSSLLGVPFSSKIVKKVLEGIINSDEELITHLQQHLCQVEQKTSLNTEHFEILDEVYEILRRQSSQNEKYHYRHGLLHTFLGKQLDYLLDSVFSENIEYAKVELIRLMVSIIDEELESLDFFGDNAQRLPEKQIQSLELFLSAKVNILAKGVEQNNKEWITQYASTLSDLGHFFYKTHRYDKAEEYYEKLGPIIKPYEYLRKKSEFCVSQNEEYMSELASSIENEALAGVCSQVFVRMEEFYCGARNMSLGCMGYDQRAVDICEYYYDKSKENWAHFYIDSLNALSLQNANVSSRKSLLDTAKKALSLSKFHYDNNHSAFKDKYIISLKNLAQLSDRNKPEDRIGLLLEAIHVAGNEYKIATDDRTYIFSDILSLLGTIYYDNNQFDLAAHYLTLDISLLKNKMSLCPKSQSATYFEDNILMYQSALCGLYLRSNQLENLGESLRVGLNMIENFSTLNLSVIKIRIDKMIEYAVIYFEAIGFEASIAQRKLFLIILEEKYAKDRVLFSTSYFFCLKEQGLSFEGLKQFESAIPLQEKALSLLERQDTDKFLTSSELCNLLDLIGSNYLRIYNYEEACKYFDKYFKLFSLQSIEVVGDIYCFVYPFVKYVQAKLHSEQYFDEQYISNMVNVFKSHMTGMFEENYTQEIDILNFGNEESDSYLAMASSENDLDIEKYKIFKRYFLNND
jgi:hypothetical protein